MSSSHEATAAMASSLPLETMILKWRDSFVAWITGVLPHVGTQMAFLGHHHDAATSEENITFLLDVLLQCLIPFWNYTTASELSLPAAYRDLSSKSIQALFQPYLIRMAIMAFVCNFLLPELYLFIFPAERTVVVVDDEDERVVASSSEVQQDTTLDTTSHNKIHTTTRLPGFFTRIFRVLYAIIYVLFYCSVVYCMTLFLGAPIPYLHTNILLQSDSSSSSSSTDSTATTQSLAAAKMWSENILNGVLFSFIFAMVVLWPIVTRRRGLKDGIESLTRSISSTTTTTTTRDTSTAQFSLSTWIRKIVSPISYFLEYSVSLILDSYKWGASGRQNALRFTEQTRAVIITFFTWCSAIVIPLDWERWYQEYPICSVYGMCVGMLIAAVYEVIMGFYLAVFGGTAAPTGEQEKQKVE